MKIQKEVFKRLDNFEETSYNKNAGGGVVLIIGRIDPKHFEDIALILTDEVVLTAKQLAHIKERHPKDYERYADYIPRVLKEPDYILEANLPNSAVLLKTFSEDGRRFQLILRLKTVDDSAEFKNSIITFMEIGDKRYMRYLRTKKVLYKSE